MPPITRPGCESIIRFLRLRRSLAPLLFMAAALSACYTPQYKPTLPEALGNEGVVVGQISDIGALKGFVQAVWLTNGKEIKITHGYFALNLAPGHYELKNLHTSTYEGANMTRHRDYPLNLRFTVREKHVTNLGVIVMLPAANTPEQQMFNMARVDNSKDIPRFFRNFYPQLSRSLALDQVDLAEGKYLDVQKLTSLRRYIVTVSPEVKNRPATAANTTRLVADELGTLAQVRYDAANKIADIRLLDMNTFSNVSRWQSDPASNRHIVVTEDQRVFMLENGKPVERSLPTANMRSPSIFPVGDKGLVATDTGCDVFTSLDNGATWHPHPELKREKCGHYRVASGAQGYYVYVSNYLSLESYPAVVVYSPHGQRNLQTLPLPSELKGIEDVQEHAGKLYVKSHHWHEKAVSEGDKKDKSAAYFVRALAGSSWKLLSLPTYSCGELEFHDDKGDRLRIRCDGDHYASKNAGQSWQPVR